MKRLLARTRVSSLLLSFAVPVASGWGNPGGLDRSGPGAVDPSDTMGVFVVCHDVTSGDIISRATAK